MSPWLVAVLAAAGLAALAAAVRGRARRRDLEQELAETRRSLEQERDARHRFFDMTTHEVRSPLTAILGYQELLEEGAFGELGDQGRDAVERIGRAGRHLQNLIDGVIELGRLRAGSVRLDRSTVELGAILSACAETFRIHASDRGLTPRVVLPDRLPAITSDQVRLARTLDLAIASAVRHPAGETMELRAEVGDRHVDASVGPLDLELRADADDPADRMGLRLAIAERTAALLGGELLLDSDGRTIRGLTLRIPLAPPL